MVLATLVLIGTCCEVCKLLVEWYDKTYIASSIIGDININESDTKSNEKLRLLKTYREESLSFFYLMFFFKLMMQIFITKISDQSTLFKVLLSFSIYSNTIKLFKITKNQDQLDCLHGIRFFSLAWYFSLIF